MGKKDYLQPVATVGVKISSKGLYSSASKTIDKYACGQKTRRLRSMYRTRCRTSDSFSLTPIFGPCMIQGFYPQKGTIKPISQASWENNWNVKNPLWSHLIVGDSCV